MSEKASVRRWVTAAGLTVAATLGCTTANEVATAFTATPDPLTTPTVEISRTDSIYATAQSVSGKGHEGLINEGFPIEAIKSQRSIRLGWEYNLMVGESSSIYASVTPCDATVVNVPEKNGFLLISATHCGSANIQSYLTRYNSEPQFPGQKVDVSGMTLKNLSFDSASLQRNQFGMAVFEDNEVASASTGVDGFTFIFVPKPNLDAAELIYLEETAITRDQIMFDVPADGSLFDAYCTTEEFGGVTTVIQDGQLVGGDNNEGLIVPARVGGGCSGGGLFVEMGDGTAKLAGALTSINKQPPHFDNGVNFYKMSHIGSQGFDNLLNHAEQDFANQPK